MKKLFSAILLTACGAQEKSQPAALESPGVQITETSEALATSDPVVSEDPIPTAAIPECTIKNEGQEIQTENKLQTIACLDNTWTMILPKPKVNSFSNTFGLTLNASMADLTPVIMDSATLTELRDLRWKLKIVTNGTEVLNAIVFHDEIEKLLSSSQTLADYKSMAVIRSWDDPKGILIQFDQVQQVTPQGQQQKSYRAEFYLTKD